MLVFSGVMEKNNHLENQVARKNPQLTKVACLDATFNKVAFSTFYDIMEID